MTSINDVVLTLKSDFHGPPGSLYFIEQLFDSKYVGSPISSKLRFHFEYDLSTMTAEFSKSDISILSDIFIPLHPYAKAPSLHLLSDAALKTLISCVADPPTAMTLVLLALFDARNGY